jgi:two-component system sensor histidine kinase/response regulator
MEKLMSDRAYNRARILIVDDEVLNQKVLKYILQADYELAYAQNGVEALELLRSQSFDLVLLDMRMPIMDGATTLTATSELNEVVSSIRLGANDYITKPLDAPLVKARVETQILLKRLMDERREAIKALEAANQLKARMMQVASHDLRNPLNNLKMLLAFIRASLQNPSAIESVLPIADQGIETMLHIIQDFLSTVTFDGTGVPLVLEQLRGSRLVEQVVEQYSLVANAKAIQLDLQVQDAWVIADGQRLQQVIGNLLSNAIKYSPPGSQVLVRSCRTEEQWRLEIYDSGAGIPENERCYLFTPFSKNLISTQPTDGESSTGLGLWIAAEMMRLQSGRIGMESPEQGGCCFWLELPLLLGQRFTEASVV